MTPRSLRDYINELPESLLDVDMEFAQDFKEMEVTGQENPEENGLWGVRADCYIGAMMHSEPDGAVLLMTGETLDKILAYNEKTGNGKAKMIRDSELNEHEIISVARNLAHRVELFHSWREYFKDQNTWLVEEMGELLVAMMHYRRGRVGKEAVVEEVVDVLICMTQLALSLEMPDDEFADMVHTKLDKAERRMEKLLTEKRSAESSPLWVKQDGLLGQAMKKIGNWLKRLLQKTSTPSTD